MHLRTGLPRAVTLDQMRAAADILGLPAGDLIGYSSDARDGISADLYHRGEDGHILAGYDGRPLMSQLELPIDRGAELPETPPSAYCAPTLTPEVRELAPTDDGWRQGEPTGRACVVCPCGLVTGWVDKAQAEQVHQAHTQKREDEG